MKLANLSKILKCAANDDAITMKSADNGDTLTFMFESAGALAPARFTPHALARPLRSCQFHTCKGTAAATAEHVYGDTTKGLGC